MNPFITSRPDRRSFLRQALVLGGAAASASTGLAPNLFSQAPMFGIKNFRKTGSLHDRANDVTFEPYGAGQIDYKPFFDLADLAGLKHFCVEQDNAAVWGDSVAAARVSCKNLNTMLTTGSLPDAYDK